MRAPKEKTDVKIRTIRLEKVAPEEARVEAIFKSSDRVQEDAHDELERVQLKLAMIRKKLNGRLNGNGKADVDAEENEGDGE